MNDKIISIIIKAQDEASKIVTGVSDKIGELSATALKYAKVAAVALGAATASAVTFGVKSAASFEQTRIGLENMLGSADQARSVLQQVSKFAADTPFEFPELAASVRQLIAFGFSGADAIKTMKQLGDVSSAVGAPIGDLSYLMGTLRTQGRAFTIDIRQFAMRGIPIYEYLASTLHKTTAEVNAMIEAGQIGFPEVAAAFDAMTAAGGKFHGAMATQSRSLAGLWSTLKDNVGLAIREMVGITQEGDVKAGSLFDKLRLATAAAINELNKIDWAAVSDKVMEMAQRIAGYLSDIGNYAITAGRSIIDNLTPAFDAIYTALVNRAQPALDNFKNWFIQLDPVVQIALSPLAALLFHFSNLSAFISDAQAHLQHFFDEFVNSTPVIIFGQFLSQVFIPKMGELWGLIASQVIPAFSQLWGSIVNVWNALNPALTEALKVVGAILGGLFIAAIYAAIEIAKLLVMAFSGVVSSIGAVIQILANVIGWLGNLVGVAINTVGTVIAIFSNFYPAVRDVIGLVIGLFASLGGMILGQLGSLAGSMYSAGRNLIGSLIFGIRSDIGSVAGEITGSVKGVLHAAHIPGFATGGYTGSGGTNEVAGIVHKGEYVVPASQVDQSTGLPKGGMGTTFNMYGNVNLGSADAVDRWFERTNTMKELGAYGVGV